MPPLVALLSQLAELLEMSKNAFGQVFQNLSEANTFYCTCQSHLPERSCMWLYDKFSTVKLKSFSSPKQNEEKVKTVKIFRRMLCFRQIKSCKISLLKS